MTRFADQLSDVDLEDLHDLLVEGRSRAGVTAAVVIEAGPAVLVDSASDESVPTGTRTWACAFRLAGRPVAVVFASEYEACDGRVEEELLRTARDLRQRLAQIAVSQEWVRGAA